MIVTLSQKAMILDSSNTVVKQLTNGSTNKVIMDLRPIFFVRDSQSIINSTNNKGDN